MRERGTKGRGGGGRDGGRRQKEGGVEGRRGERFFTIWSFVYYFNFFYQRYVGIKYSKILKVIYKAFTTLDVLHPQSSTIR